MTAEVFRLLTAAVTAAHPTTYCCGGLAKRLSVDEFKLRDCAQILLVRERRRFFLARRLCAGCQEIDDVFGLKNVQ
jgi:hypothetical protein